MEMSTGQRAIAMLSGFDRSKWSACTTMGAKPQINTPGWEITEVVEGVFQAVAISSRYRFCGQGSDPHEALADAVGVMREFHNELTQHIEGTHV